MIVRHHARAVLLSLRRLLCLSMPLLLSSLPTISQAQITLDGSLGYRGALHGPNYTISDRVGQIRGSNLFHSFGQFNLSKGESATFTGPNTIANILSRVTGGSPSNIDGTIRSQIPKANFYLINPSGVMFGPNASLDVSGSFHVSTADYLRLADGATFSANSAVHTVLSMAPPAAFGFLGPTPAAVSIQGSALHVPPGQTLSVIGGDIEIVGGVLVASGGRINLASVATAGEVGVNPADPMTPLQVGTFAHLGRIDLVDAFLDTSGLGGGTVVIRGGRLLVDQSFVFADTQGAVDGVKIGVDINVAGEVAITNGSGITTDALGAGHAGDIRIRAKSIEASDTAFIASRPFSTGDGGDIVVEVGRLTLTRGAQINTSTFSVGRGGSVTVTASDTLALVGTSPDGTFASGIFASPLGTEPGAGAAGTIVVSAPRVIVTDGAAISSRSFGPGHGGSIMVTANDTLTLAGTSPDGFFLSGIFATARGTEDGAGAAGSIVVSAPRILVTGGASIASGSKGPGHGGSITVTASDTLTLTGTSPDGVFASGIFASAEGTQVGAGAAGSIVVSAPRILVTDGAQIFSGTFGPGHGGSVTVMASDTLTLVGTGTDSNGLFPSGIFADAEGTAGGAGAAGTIVVSAPRVTVTGGAQVASGTFGPGHGGSVTVTASDTLTLAGTSPDGAFASGIFANAEGTAGGAGAAGSIVVSASRIMVTDGAAISSRSFGPGHGGSITVTANDTLTLAGTSPDGFFLSGIFATARGTEDGAGAAGSIVVSAPRILVTGGASIASGSKGPGHGGSITVTASDTLTLTGTSPDGVFASGIFASAEGTQVRAGAAGSIVVSAPRILVTDGAQIFSGTFGPGHAGDVIVQASKALTITAPGQRDADGFFTISGVFTDTFGSGAAGRVTVTAPTLRMDNGVISSESQGDSMGDAGTVVVEGRTLTLSGGAQISSSTFGPGPGHGGDVTVRTSEALTITGRRDADGKLSGVLSSTSGSGAAGRVTVVAPTLRMDDSLISSDSNAGSTGDAGTVVVEGRTLTLSGGAQISSSTSGPGHGGDVTVRASEALTITAPGQDAGGFFVISGLFSNTFGSGAAGRVTVAAPTLRMDNGQITSECQGGTGDAGTVVVEGRTLTLSGGAQISSGTFGSGHGGDVTVEVSEALTITGRRDADAFRSGVSSSTFGSGAAGRVTVTAPTLRMDDGVIQARAGQRPSGAAGSILTLQEAPDATGDAGSILITAGSITLTGGAQIDSRTGGRGRGGLVVVTATDTVSMAGHNRDGTPSGLVSLTSSATAGAGDAGTVLLAAPHVQLTDGGQIQTSTSGAGNAGIIVVGAFEQQVEGMTVRGPQVEQVTLTGGAQITSSSGRIDATGAVVAGSGRGGTVTVTTTDALIIAGHDPTGTVPSGVVSQTFGAGDAGRVAITTGQLRLEDGGRLSVDTGGDGRGGDLTVQARQVTIAGGAQLNSRSGLDVGNNISLVGAGAGGTVTVTAADTVTITGQASGLAATTAGPGKGGDIALQAREITLTDGALLTADTSGAGNAGRITVTAQELVRTANSKMTTNTRGSGDAGRVAVTAPIVEMTEGRVSAVTSGAGNAGDVVITAGRLTLIGQAQIDSSSAGTGQGGQVTVTATEAITIGGLGGIASNAASQGAAGTVAITAPTLQMDGPVAIEAHTTGAGDAGNVDIHVAQLYLTGGARIGSTSGTVDATGTVVAGPGHGGQVTVTATEALLISGQDSTGNESGVFSQTFGPGDAGRIAVTTPRLTLADGGRISAETGGDGHGGDVTVQASRLELMSGAQITGSSGITLGPTRLVGAGHGGTVMLTTTDPVLLTGQGTGLFTRTAGPGQGGDITVQAPRLTLLDGATISAESTGLGNAGKITLTLGDSFVSTHGSIVTRATLADGGDIHITAPNFLRLRDSAITAEVGGGATTIGGNIFIDPQFVLLQNSQIVANAAAGQGGNIRIQAQQVFLADPTSQVSASSALGIDGQVAIQAPIANVSGTVASLPQVFARTGELLRDRCGERVRGGTMSHFVLRGRDGVPLEPGSLLLSLPVRAEQPAVARMPESVAGQREVSFEPVRGLESNNTSYLSLRGAHGQAQWLEALDVECARWRWMQGTDVKTVR